ncbi:MAG: hypothetical protein GWN01_16085 [Nitrosopumilaceae archaeon]|nr:hypothetical protein [Nitrosopumilaceae archaeon]NIU02357.1 hypothetical protein [Nitrosopumilaceae archaeon]NIU88814.1 hypothetical protein [Nitrosopumilaceae archaeon]NIV66939.1 hypothetical protein [Nitrosopumilaceae archaeon]NIX62958.1 hypothetical protein [Nitrosopumilaceae archaeon]
MSVQNRLIWENEQEDYLYILILAMISLFLISVGGMIHEYLVIGGSIGGILAGIVAILRYLKKPKPKLDLNIKDKGYLNRKDKGYSQINTHFLVKNDGDKDTSITKARLKFNLDGKLQEVEDESLLPKTVKAGRAEDFFFQFLPNGIINSPIEDSELTIEHTGKNKKVKVDKIEGS